VVEHHQHHNEVPVHALSGFAGKRGASAPVPHRMRSWSGQFAGRFRAGFAAVSQTHSGCCPASRGRCRGGFILASRCLVSINLRRQRLSSCVGCIPSADRVDDQFSATDIDKGILFADNAEGRLFHAGDRAVPGAGVVPGCSELCPAAKAICRDLRRFVAVRRRKFAISESRIDASYFDRTG
jgi:hypothetical protein